MFRTFHHQEDAGFAREAKRRARRVIILREARVTTADRVTSLVPARTIYERGGLRFGRTRLDRCTVAARVYVKLGRRFAALSALETAVPLFRQSAEPDALCLRPILSPRAMLNYCTGEHLLPEKDCERNLDYTVSNQAS